MFGFLIKFLTKTNKWKNQGHFKKRSHPSRNLLSFSLSLFQMPADRIFAVIVSILSMTFYCAEPQGNHSGISSWNLFALLLGNFPTAHKVTGPDGNVKMVCLNRMECVSSAVQSTCCVKRYLTQILLMQKHAAHVLSALTYGNRKCGPCIMKVLAELNTFLRWKDLSRH